MHRTLHLADRINRCDSERNALCSHVQQSSGSLQCVNNGGNLSLCFVKWITHWCLGLS